MRIELIIIAITAFVMYNIYNDGKYSKWYLIWKKEIQMGIVGLIGLSLYLVVKRNPSQCKHILHHANNVVKYMPIDKSSLSIISPILDFTNSSAVPFLDEMNRGMNHGGSMNHNNGGNNVNYSGISNVSSAPNGVKATKRSVSETKKKYVASMQNWKCGECSKQLNAWFEVDHKVRLEYGGSNEVSNLVALCRECHGKKTAMENM
jgi:5-methylcytosine-specific restriction endonuclease McrA